MKGLLSRCSRGRPWLWLLLEEARRAGCAALASTTRAATRASSTRMAQDGRIRSTIVLAKTQPCSSRALRHCIVGSRADVAPSDPARFLLKVTRTGEMAGGVDAPACLAPRRRIRLVACVLSTVCGVGLGRTFEPHPHAGILKKYDRKHPSKYGVSLRGISQAQLRSGKPVLKLVPQPNGFKRTIGIQEINAPPDVVFGRITDWANYAKMIKDVKRCGVYRRGWTMSGSRVACAKYEIKVPYVSLDFYVEHVYDPLSHCMSLRAARVAPSRVAPRARTRAPPQLPRLHAQERRRGPGRLLVLRAPARRLDAALLLDRLPDPALGSRARAPFLPAARQRHGLSRRSRPSRRACS